MIQKVLLVALVLIAAQAIHLNQAHEAAVLKAGKVTIQADNGNYLRVCHNCGGLKDDQASIQDIQGDDTQKWVIQSVGTNKIAIKGSNGKYLSLCSECWAGSGPKEAAFAHVDTVEDFNTWIPEKLKNGKYAFKMGSKYLALCHDCTYGHGASYDMAFIHVNSSNASYAQWTVTYV